MPFKKNFSLYWHLVGTININEASKTSDVAIRDNRTIVSLVLSLNQSI